MTTNVEIDSFTSKFKALLFNGIQASLSFESKDGEAFVVLKAGLGSCHVTKTEMKHHHEYFNFKKSRSPSYQRRQEKRRLEKLSSVVEGVDHGAEEEFTAIAAEKAAVTCAFETNNDTILTDINSFYLNFKAHI